jgi:16S rRNA (guanine(966)-N(2))-methyltransferase RsmD
LELASILITKDIKYIDMRIISGKFKGSRLDFKVPPETRPTTDFVKEMIFNVIDNLIDLDERVVYDLFAGTGAFGFESISRGANLCYFIDKSFKACDYIKRIAIKLKIPDSQYSILKKDVLKFLKTDFLESEFEKPDIIFIDAPYEKILENLTLALIKKNSVFKDGCIIIVEHSESINLIIPSGFELVNSKIAGSTKIDFIQCKL